MFVGESYIIVQGCSWDHDCPASSYNIPLTWFDQSDRNFSFGTMLPPKKLRAHGSLEFSKQQAVVKLRLSAIILYQVVVPPRHDNVGAHFRTKQPCFIFHHENHCHLWPVFFIGRVYTVDLSLGGDQPKRRPTPSWTAALASAADMVPSNAHGD